MNFFKQLATGWRRPISGSMEPAGKSPPTKNVKNHTPRKKLEQRLQQIIYHPHPEFRAGILTFAEACFTAEDRDCNVCIARKTRIDCTADVTIGPWTMIGEDTHIITHDHYHEGRDKPLLLLQEEKGIWWSDLVIGSDVWLHGCTVLAQVTEIPDGVVIGAGAVLTENPGPYEIWAGTPARKIKDR